MHRDYQTLLDEMAALEIKILDGEPTKADYAKYKKLQKEYKAHPDSRKEEAVTTAWVNGFLTGKYDPNTFHEDIKKIKEKLP